VPRLDKRHPLYQNHDLLSNWRSADAKKVQKWHAQPFCSPGEAPDSLRGDQSFRGTQVGLL